MPARLRLCGLALLLFLLTFSRNAIAQTEFRLSGADWKITLPKGWQQIPAEEMLQLNAEARQASEAANAKRVISYAAGFRPSPPDGSYFLVQYMPAPPAGARFDSISANLAEVLRKSSQTFKANPFETTPTIYGDATGSRILVHNTGRGTGEHIVNNISFWNLGSTNLVILHTYAPKADFARFEPTLSAIIDSFTFDPGKVYAYGTADANFGSSKSMDSSIASHALRGAIFGVLFAVAMMIIKKIRGS